MGAAEYRSIIQVEALLWTYDTKWNTLDGINMSQLCDVLNSTDHLNICEWRIYRILYRAVMWVSTYF